ncbi:RNA polymerase sigma factor FliA [Microvirgula aerodenitrificans]|uniref:RNA polymerase sigma factor FliA n=1 Tax=Microvirgula aerodenitrificans TaxID=57480 RepID=UPI00248D48A3|nr:RNA polymerase sigma factor FliA [Microvirgula aerodenitrificans]
MKLRRAYLPADASTTVDVATHAPLVRKLASMMVSRLPASVELDDLIQVGMIGLLEAAQQFDTSQGVLFETFASQRIRGAMLDELRRIDWLPRQARRNAKQIEQALTALEQEFGRAPHESEVAERLEMSIDEYQSMLYDCKGHQLVYYEDFRHESDEGSSTQFIEHVAGPEAETPFAMLGDQRFREHLVAAIKELPERDQLVMNLYYEEELNLKEIGAVLGVTESRVCQLHSQAVSRLRGKLRNWI